MKNFWRMPMHAEEDAVDRQICSLEESLKALRHKKATLAAATKEDVAKLLEKMRALSRLQLKQRELGRELSRVLENAEAAKKCQYALEDMHASAREAATNL
ncbi:hypothetical protein TSUD_299050 [Trifolium subterraneum]|nr:hypothetical protein TSUD_299050 [Trifolium subterraneum]